MYADERVLSLSTLTITNEFYLPLCPSVNYLLCQILLFCLSATSRDSASHDLTVKVHRFKIIKWAGDVAVTNSVTHLVSCMLVYVYNCIISSLICNRLDPYVASMSQSLYGGITAEQQLNAYKQLQQHQQNNHLTPHQQQELWQQVIVSLCLLPHIPLPLEYVGWH